MAVSSEAFPTYRKTETPEITIELKGYPTSSRPPNISEERLGLSEWERLAKNPERGRKNILLFFRLLCHKKRRRRIFFKSLRMMWKCCEKGEFGVPNEGFISPPPAILPGNLFVPLSSLPLSRLPLRFVNSGINLCFLVSWDKSVSICRCFLEPRGMRDTQRTALVHYESLEIKSLKNPVQRFHEGSSPKQTPISCSGKTRSGVQAQVLLWHVVKIEVSLQNFCTFPPPLPVSLCRQYDPYELSQVGCSQLFLTPTLSLSSRKQKCRNSQWWRKWSGGNAALELSFPPQTKLANEGHLSLDSRIGLLTVGSWSPQKRPRVAL